MSVEAGCSLNCAASVVSHTGPSSSCSHIVGSPGAGFDLRTLVVAQCSAQDCSCRNKCQAQMVVLFPVLSFMPVSLCMKAGNGCPVSLSHRLWQAL